MLLKKPMIKYLTDNQLILWNLAFMGFTVVMHIHCPDYDSGNNNNNNKHTFIYRHLQENQNSSGLQTKMGYKIA